MKQEALGQEGEPVDRREEHEAGSGDRSMSHETGV
jgi:hypothetical protein